MSVGARLAIYLFAAVLGAGLPLFNLPLSAMTSLVVALLIAAIGLYYRAAWRQGHSGIVILPLVAGQFGASALTLRLSKSERAAIAAIAMFFFGLGCGVAWLVVHS